MSTKARTSIRAQLMRLSLVIVVVSIALSLVGTLSYTLHTEQQSLDSNLINSASILAQVPLVQSALLDELPAEDLADFLDETTARTSDIDLILVTDRENILRYVPDREMTGDLYTGTAPLPALAGAEAVYLQRDWSHGDRPLGLCASAGPDGGDHRCGDRGRLCPQHGPGDDEHGAVPAGDRHRGGGTGGAAGTAAFRAHQAVASGL